MGQRRGAAAKKPAEAPPEEAPADTPVNGVLVTRALDPDNPSVINVDVQALGDVRLTEVDTILLMGRKRLAEALEAT